MRWSATLGGWNRRKTVLAACLAAAAALAGLAVQLKLPWLGVAGLVVAAAGALASLVISTEQARLEGKRERVTAGRSNACFGHALLGGCLVSRVETCR